MRLYVMRHGPAEDRAPSGRDADRKLTGDGRARVRRVAEELRDDLAGAPPRVLASPLLRARETAEIVAELLGSAAPEIRDELALDADLPLRLVAELAAVGEDVLLVGHAPRVDHLVRVLAPGPDHRPPSAMAGGFCTAMVAALEPLDSPERASLWQVLHVVDPRALG